MIRDKHFNFVIGVLLFAAVLLLANAYSERVALEKSFLKRGLIDEKVYQRFAPSYVVITSFFESESNANSSLLKGDIVLEDEGFVLIQNLSFLTACNQSCLLTNLSLDYFWRAPDGDVVPVLFCDFNCSKREIYGLAFYRLLQSRIFISRKAVASDYWLTLFHEQCHQLVARGFLNSTKDTEVFCDVYASEKFQTELERIVGR